MKMQKNNLFWKLNETCKLKDDVLDHWNISEPQIVGQM